MASSKGQRYYSWGIRAMESGERDKALRSFVSAYCEEDTRDAAREAIEKEFIAPRREEYRRIYNANRLKSAGLPPYEDITLSACPLAASFFVFDFANAHVFEAPCPADCKAPDGTCDLVAPAPAYAPMVLKAASGTSVHLIGDVALCALLFTETGAKRIFWYRDEADYAARFYDNQQCVLCVAIPSWNRGAWALRAVHSFLRHNMYAEAGLCLYDNASDKGLEQYAHIRDCADARVRYHRNAENILCRNFGAAVAGSHGMYACLLSDEDVVLMGAMPYYIHLLRNNMRVGCLGTSIENHARFEKAYLERGADALTYGILQDNYITGRMYNVALFKALKVDEAAGRFYANGNQAAHYYYHSVFAIVMNAYADYVFDTVALTRYVNDYVPEDAERRPDGLAYASFEARVAQLKGFCEIFEWMRDEHGVGDDVLTAMLNGLFGKYAFLVAVNFTSPVSRGQYAGETVETLRGKLLSVFDEQLKAMDVPLGAAVYADCFVRCTEEELTT